MSWTPGPLDHITISPASATIAAGDGQAFTARALDQFDNSLGDVTLGTRFAMSPEGACTNATCVASSGGPHTVTATYQGQTATAALTVTGGVAPYAFTGFAAPIDMSTSSVVVWNTLKAGRTVPAKWRVTLNGVPVADPGSFARLWSYPVACSSGSGSLDDAIDVGTPGQSGLQYKGDGNWQMNWKTQAAHKGTCRALIVTFSDGTTSPAARFKFVK